VLKTRDRNKTSYTRDLRISNRVPLFYEDKTMGQRIYERQFNSEVQQVVELSCLG